MVNLYALDELAKRKQSQYEHEASHERWLREVAPGSRLPSHRLVGTAGRVLVVLGLWLQARAVPQA